MIFLDLGTNLFQGLEEFTTKLNLDTNATVYCFEPNTLVYNNSKQKYDSIKNNYKILNHFNKAVLDYTGEIIFNSHNGVWLDGRYIDDYTGGSNCLGRNPKKDIGNGAIFDIHQEVVECIDINDVLKTIVDDNNLSLKSIIVKCDIEGSEFKVLPKLLQSEYLKYIKEIHVEWHERFFHDNKNDYNNICKLKNNIIHSLHNNNIECYEHH